MSRRGRIRLLSANAPVIAALRELASFTAIEDGSPQSFRARAYVGAIRAIEGLSRPVASMSASELAGVRGIGKSTAAKVREFVETGRIDKLERLRETHPPGQLDLLRVPGVGPKTVTLLWKELGVGDLADLETAATEGRLRHVQGLGERTERQILSSLERLKSFGTERTPIARAWPLAERFAAGVRERTGGAEVTVAGSLRRFRETVKDVDLLVVTDEPEAAMTAAAEHEEVVEVVAAGPTKTSVRTLDRLQVDVRAVEPGQAGAALLYFTGSQAHNIRLRERALARDLTLNEYALARPDGAVIAGRDEAEVYSALDLTWVPPELREDAGEVELAARGDLPRLVEVEDLRGDLHDHSDWSGDGRIPLGTLVASAEERGYEYFAVTDHAEDLRINGLSRAAMLAQRRELESLRERHDGLALLHGAELNIDPDGGLDYDPEFLAGFDWGVASVHSAFDLPPERQTRRLVTAMRNPAVNVIGHLLGRRIGRRPGIEADLDVVLDAAIETGTGIEINSSLDRLDAPAEVLREGAARGVTFVLSTDTHALHELDNVRYGVRHARRGMVPADQIANTWPAGRFLAWTREVRQA